MKPLELFIGPCMLESRELAMEVAKELKNQLAPFEGQIRMSFKGSFDKANRSSIDSYRGPGLEKGLAILSEVKEKYGYELITDFHTPEQAQEVAKVVDTLQVPAFLCRQTDMIIAGAKACAENKGRLKIKKGQFLSPAETKNIVDKAENFLPKESILLTERGSSFGYNHLIVDMTSFQIMKSFGVTTIHDATHCVQRPGALGKVTGAYREGIPALARAALAAGADGIFMECHPNPEKAKSDSTSCLKVTEVRELIGGLLKIYQLVQKEGFYHE